MAAVTSLVAPLDRANAAEPVDAAAAAAAAAAARGDAVVDAVLVNGRRSTLVDIPTVPGATSVVTAESLAETRIATVSDALAYVPGVFAQSVSGGEGTVLSVRGSGITKGGFTWGNGTQILFDGLPVTSPLGTPYESFEPNALARLEVFKGANAFEYGATQLGGAINFVQHTGRDSSPLFVRLEAGSNGYQRQQISSGGVHGPFDYYVSLTHFQTDGFRDHAGAWSARLIGNIGYEITPKLRTRFYWSYTKQDQQNINAITWAQLLANPEQNTANGRRTNRGSLFLANKTTLEIDEASSLEFGLGYKKPPLFNGNVPQQTYWDTSDWSASLKYRRHDTLFGHESDTTVAFIPTGVIGDSGATVRNVNTKAVLGKIKYGGSNTTLLVSNDFAVTPRLWVLTGIAWNQQTRRNNIVTPVPAGVKPDIEKTYTDLIPRFGARYEVAPGVQIYGNVSGILEAPQIISFATQVNGAYTGYGNNGDLKAQSGTNFEVGVKGGIGRIRWDVAWYRTKLKNELLTVFTALPSPTNPNGITATTNAAPTIHEGIEAAAEATLWSSGDNRLSLRQAYTWSNFRFEDRNLAAGRGVLPRIPKHFYQAELTFNHASGLYATANLEAVLSRYPVDYVNQIYLPSYALFGAAIGWQEPRGRWRVFVQGQNLGDKRYAASASATINAAGGAIYLPGQGRTVTGGVSYAF